MKAIEYSALLRTAKEAGPLLKMLSELAGTFGHRLLTESEGYRVCCYFPLGEVDERAELAQGYRVVTLPAHLPWPRVPAR